MSMSTVRGLEGGRTTPIPGEGRGVSVEEVDTRDGMFLASGRGDVEIGFSFEGITDQSSVVHLNAVARGYIEEIGEKIAGYEGKLGSQSMISNRDLAFLGTISSNLKVLAEILEKKGEKETSQAKEKNNSVHVFAMVQIVSNLATLALLSYAVNSESKSNIAPWVGFGGGITNAVGVRGGQVSKRRELMKFDVKDMQLLVGDLKRLAKRVDTILRAIRALNEKAGGRTTPRQVRTLGALFAKKDSGITDPPKLVSTMRRALSSPHNQNMMAHFDQGNILERVRALAEKANSKLPINRDALICLVPLVQGKLETHKESCLESLGYFVKSSELKESEFEDNLTKYAQEILKLQCVYDVLRGKREVQGNCLQQMVRKGKSMMRVLGDWENGLHPYIQYGNVALVGGLVTAYQLTEKLLLLQFALASTGAASGSTVSQWIRTLMMRADREQQVAVDKESPELRAVLHKHYATLSSLSLAAALRIIKNAGGNSIEELLNRREGDGESFYDTVRQLYFNFLRTEMSHEDICELLEKHGLNILDREDPVFPDVDAFNERVQGQGDAGLDSFGHTTPRGGPSRDVEFPESSSGTASPVDGSDMSMGHRIPTPTQGVVPGFPAEEDGFRPIGAGVGMENAQN